MHTVVYLLLALLLAAVLGWAGFKFGKLAGAGQCVRSGGGAAPYDAGEALPGGASGIASVSKLDTKSNPPKVRLDLFGKSRPFVEIVLPPEGLVVSLGLPSKRIADGLPDIGALIDGVYSGKAGSEELNRLYEVTMDLLERNLDCTPIDREQLVQALTTDDCAEILAAYLEFLAEELNVKN